ncbi:MAG: methyltransferase domain-containing protein, partial [Candidatus Diapherotrites archaeon]
ISEDVKPDLVHDLEKPFPFKSSSVDFILAKHVIEHLRNPIEFIEECWRILKLGGEIHIFSPHISQLESSGELDHHRSGLGVFSFHYCSNFSINKRNYYSKAFFKIKKVRIHTHPVLQFLADLSPIKYEKYFSRFFGARQIEFLLEKSSNK